MDMEAFEKHREKIIIVVINLLYMVSSKGLGGVVFGRNVDVSWLVWKTGDKRRLWGADHPSRSAAVGRT